MPHISVRIMAERKEDIREVVEDLKKKLGSKYLVKTSNKYYANRKTGWRLYLILEKKEKGKDYNSYSGKK